MDVIKPPLTLLVLLLIFLCTVTQAEGLQPSSTPVEAGDVDWRRDFEAALEQSRTTGKPLLVLFQEIPGCLGCRTFGQEVLRHPLLVEAIESEFLPVLVYNNRPSTRDAELLRRFDEPSWNYQVIRFLDSNGNDIIPRRDRVWSISGVAKRMIAALQAVNRPVPLYLKGIMWENDTGNHAVAAFAMACFWTGEFKLGKIEGVVATEAGWYDHREVTRVTYHKKIITLDRLVQLAAKERCAQRVYLPPGTTVDRNRFEVYQFKEENYRKAKASDQKKQLEGWPDIQTLGSLTPIQATKLNSYLPIDTETAFHWLSPRQRDTLGIK